MLTNELIEDGNNYYYVDANGAMVKNTWVAVPADDSEDQDVDYRWYYFGSNGKAYRDADKKTINGKKYGFDDEGKMLFGFVSGLEVINDEDDAVLHCDRYYGTNDDGAMHTGWLLYQDAIDTEDYDDEYYWFWFNSSGEKYDNPNKTKKINGKYYAFDDKGVMQYEWYDEATITSTSTLGWFNSQDDGHLAKSEWIWTSAEDYTLDGNDDDHWFYADKHGELVKGETKKINGKWYAFDDAGQMQWGLVFLSTESVKDSKAAPVAAIADEKTGVAITDPEDIEADDIKAIDMKADKAYLHFFSNDEEKDGSMKSGYSVKIELYDDTYTFGFDKNSGAAFNGIEKNKLYWNGILQTASDNRYEKVKGSNGGEYLVSSNGTRMKPSASRTYKDSDDQFWGVKSGNDKDGYEVVGPCDSASDVKDLLK
jgi:hypothetical protein